MYCPMNKSTKQNPKNETPRKQPKPENAMTPNRNPNQSQNQVLITS